MFLMTSVEVLKILRLRVLMIMLANPMRIVVIIPRDIMPPVSVLYYRSLSKRNISVE